MRQYIMNGIFFQKNWRLTRLHAATRARTKRQTSRKEKPIHSSVETSSRMTSRSDNTSVLTPLDVDERTSRIESNKGRKDNSYDELPESESGLGGWLSDELASTNTRDPESMYCVKLRFCGSKRNVEVDVSHMGSYNLTFFGDVQIWRL